MSKQKILRRQLLSRWRQLLYLNKYRIDTYKAEWFQPPESEPLENKVVLVICGFGDENYQKAAQRLAEQALALERFSNIHIFTQLDDVPGLSTARKLEVEALAKKFPRGWGLWAWKPVVLAALMNKLDEGIEVFYIDAGCEISPWGGALFDRWRSQLQDKGSLFFSIPYKEREWTTESVLNHFGLATNSDAPQIQATWFGLINNDTNRALVERWASECLDDNGILLSDQGDDSGEYLLEHREDQSVLSCLIRSTGVGYVTEHQDHFHPELYKPNSWILLMPIHTLRARGSFSLLEKIISKSSENICKSRLKRRPNISFFMRILRFLKDAVVTLRGILNFLLKNILNFNN